MEQEQAVPENLERALRAIADRAAMGVRTWQRLLEFIALRATAEEEYVAAAECNDVGDEGPPRRSATLRHHRFPVLAALTPPAAGAGGYGGGSSGYQQPSAGGHVPADVLSNKWSASRPGKGQAGSNDLLET